MARLRGRERRRPAGLQGPETRTGSVLTALCGTQPRRHLDLGLAASRTATCCRLSRQSVVLCYGGPRTRGRHPRASDLRSGWHASPRRLHRSRQDPCFSLPASHTWLARTPHSAASGSVWSLATPPQAAAPPRTPPLARTWTIESGSRLASCIHLCAQSPSDKRTSKMVLKRKPLESHRPPISLGEEQLVGPPARRLAPPRSRRRWPWCQPLPRHRCRARLPSAAPHPGLLTRRSRSAWPRRSADLALSARPSMLTMRVTHFGQCNGGGCDSPIIRPSSQVLSEAHGTDPTLPLRHRGRHDRGEK